MATTLRGLVTVATNLRALLDTAPDPTAGTVPSGFRFAAFGRQLSRPELVGYLDGLTEALAAQLGVTLPDPPVEPPVVEPPVTPPVTPPVEPPVQPPTDPHPAPTGFTATVLTDSRIHLAWVAAPGATSYPLRETNSPDGVGDSPIVGVTSDRGPFNERRKFRYGVSALYPDGTESAVVWVEVDYPSTAPPVTPPQPGGGVWRTLPVLTSSAATGERSSFQSSVPSWQPDGMHVALLARGDKSGTPNPTSGGDTQRCEIWISGWGDLTGRQFLRYDFTLKPGFPTDTGTWQAITQCKNSSTGSPPLELMVNRGEVNLQWHSKGGSETGREVLGRATTGVPHSVVLEVPFTTSSNAPVSGWFDGAQAFTGRSHGPTLYSGQSSYGKAGLYRSNSIGRAAEIVFHAITKGDTFAAVT